MQCVYVICMHLGKDVKFIVLETEDDFNYLCLFWSNSYLQKTEYDLADAVEMRSLISVKGTFKEFCEYISKNNVTIKKSTEIIAY